MALKKFDRERKNFELINPALRIPDDHICFVVKEIVESIDFTQANEKFLHTPGEPTYDRELMTLLVLMGAIDGKFSARDLEYQAKFNFVYIYLTANSTPNYRTIQRFKNDNPELLREAFVRTREIGRKLGIIHLKNLAQDGTTVKAKASKNSRFEEIDLLIAKELIEKGIHVEEEEDRLYEGKSGRTFTKKEFTQLKKEIRKTKAQNKKHKGKKSDKKGAVDDFNIKKKVLNVVMQGEKNKEKTLEKIDKALDAFEGKTLDKVSFTDPEAHWRPNKKHYYELVHNLQIIGDTDSRFIIENQIVDAATDMNQLIPLISGLQKEIGVLDDDTLLNVDNGYFCGNNLKFIDGQEFNVLMPNKSQASQAKGKQIPKFAKHNFEYDSVNDSYTCPHGKILPHQSISRKGVKQYYTNDCHSCLDKNNCCKSNVRIISAYENEQLMQKMKLEFEKEENKEKYSQRAIVEGNFAHMFHNLRYNTLHTIGTQKAQTESNILSFANNVKRIHNIKKINNTTQPKYQNNT
jgi:transposase